MCFMVLTGHEPGRLSRGTCSSWAQARDFEPLGMTVDRFIPSAPDKPAPVMPTHPASLHRARRAAVNAPREERSSRTMGARPYG
jgi:hypothetical protein